jgi:thioredoxin reductase
MLGSEGIDPEQLLASAWTEALKLGLSFTNRRVDRVERTKDVFIVSAGDSVLAARCVVFAYGVVDQIPSVPGAAELYGRGVFHCPTCDAFEVMHQTLAAYGPASKAATLALELLTWAKWVLVFSNGTAAEMDHRLRTRLDSAGVKVIDERVRRLIAERDRLAAIELETGKRVNVGALFFTLDTKRGATLAENLGCAIDEETDTVKVDEQRETTVRGAYAVGDIVAGPHLVVKAAADGAIAAIAIHKSLEGA